MLPLKTIPMALVDAAAGVVAARVPANVIELLMNICGMWALVTPLALWIAWTPELLAIALVTGVSAIVMAGVLYAALEISQTARVHAPSVPQIPKPPRYNPSNRKG